MKLKTSFFNKTIFRKSLTRFAPAWVLYTLCLLLGMMILIDNGTDYYLVDHMCDLIQVMPVINLGYAVLCAMLLFSDLYNSRMCNALHALPLRREGWFLTNVASGLLFSLVPSLVMTLLALPLCAMSKVTDGWLVPLYWLLGTNLQFITFFGIAVFSAFCVGSLLALFVVYGILNFCSLLAAWTVDSLYTPMLFGVQTDFTPFWKLCPVANLVEPTFIECTPIRYDDGVHFGIIGGEIFVIPEAWGRLWIWAAVGIGLMVLGLLLYRRRNLESAGDFIAVKTLKPVFLIIYTLCVGIVMHFFQNIFLGDAGLVWLFVGLIVGFFTGLMLLSRTLRVFTKKAFLACGGLVLVVVLSLLVTAFDLFGIESWIPKETEVRSVSVCPGYASQDVYPDGEWATLDSQEDIALALRLHELALEQRGHFSQWEFSAHPTVEEIIYEDNPQDYARATTNFTLRYELSGGRTAYRYYRCYIAGEAGQILTPWFSSLQAVLGIREDEISQFIPSIQEIYVDGNPVANQLSQAQIESLISAFAADCAEGTMVQDWDFHQQAGGDPVCNIEFELWESNKIDRWDYWRYIRIYPECRHVSQWLEDNGMHEYMVKYQEELSK